ncbi:hypothetical protein [Teredinibacter purpureus]|nr:hypothetical protein [Teredinibacter purpureus]
MNSAVMVSGLAMFGSMGLIVVIALVASGLLAFFENKMDHSNDH